MDRQPTGASTVDQEEIARFSRLAGQWWDPRGPMAALHKFNPVRLAYIRDRTAEHFGRDPTRLDSLTGLRILGLIARCENAIHALDGLDLRSWVDLEQIVIVDR